MVRILISIVSRVQSWKSTGASSSQLFQDFEDLCRVLDDFGVALKRRQEVLRDREAALEVDIDGIADRLSALSASMQRSVRNFIAIFVFSILMIRPSSCSQSVKGDYPLCISARDTLSEYPQAVLGKHVSML